MTGPDAERGNVSRRKLDLWIGRVLIVVLRAFRARRKRPAGIESFGLLMFGAIGDTILASAILHDLRRAFPNARIKTFVSIANKGTVDLLAGFDEVVVVPVTKPHLAVPLVRRHPVDVLIDIGQWARISALIAMLARARFTVGFRTPGQFRHWAFDAVADHSPDCHELQNFRALLGPLGIQGTSMPRLKAEVMTQGRMTRSGRRHLVFHPWAAGYRSALREWRESNWIELARIAIAWGYRIIITGGPGDQVRAVAMAAAIGHADQVEVTAGRASLRDSAIMLGRAAAVVTVNTGTMHLAAAIDSPMVALHGPTNHRRWGPLSKSAIVVGPGPEEGGAFLNLGFEYPRSPPDCMAMISVAEVARSLRKLLEPQETARDVKSAALYVV